MHSIMPYTFPNMLSFLYENAALQGQFATADTVMQFQDFISWPCAAVGEELKFIPETQLTSEQKLQSVNHLDLLAYDSECVKQNSEFLNSNLYYPHFLPYNYFRKKERSLIYDFK